MTASPNGFSLYAAVPRRSTRHRRRCQPASTRGSTPRPLIADMNLLNAFASSVPRIQSTEMNDERTHLFQKPAVILHADVIGSTRLVLLGEALAHTRSVATYKDLAATIRSFGGTAHEIRGDTSAAEFSRAPNAPGAALQSQANNETRNGSLEDDVCPRVRIGVGSGEVIGAAATFRICRGDVQDHRFK